MSPEDFSFDKFDSDARKIYLQALRDGDGKVRAARKAGVSRELVRHYRARDPDFVPAERAAAREGVQDKNEQVENALFEAATEDRNVTACQVWLYNRRPQKWADKRQAGKGSDLDLTKLSDDELATLARLTAKAGRGGDGQADAPTVVEGK